MLKKIRRMLALQGLMWSAALYFGWKHRDAIERSVRAARAAWDEAGGEPTGVQPVVLAAVVVADDRTAENPLDELVDSMPSAAEAARPGF